jgi:hypothetical protein
MENRHMLLFLLLFCPTLLGAQEVKYLDLTAITQRTELRYPPAPPPNCEEGKPCAGGGWGGVSIADGTPDIGDSHALGVQLLQVTPADINPAQPLKAEFRVLNTGLAPIELPISPHLSDLQPADESSPFTYLSLALVLQVEDESQKWTPVLGYVELYGFSDQDGMTLVLKPGQWIRVKANVKFRSSPPQAMTAFLRGGFWLRKNTYTPHPGGSYTAIENLYPNSTRTPAIPAHLIIPSGSPSSQ